MGRSKQDHGVVALAALDLRRRPDHRAELASQLLMGEVVRVIEGDHDAPWLRVENRADRYAGWVRSYGVRLATRARAGRWLELATARVISPFAYAFAAQTGNRVVTPLYWNGRVIPGRKAGGRRAVELPDGRRGWVDSGALQARPGRIGLMDRIEGLMGTPYHWGGRTPHGFDCSGLVQQLMAEQGVALPRDAHDQYLETRCRIEPAELVLGDLLFFGRSRTRMEHVGLMLGEGYFVHASGAVRVNSVEPSNPFYDKVLGRQLRAFGRTKLNQQTNRSRSRKYREPA